MVHGGCCLLVVYVCLVSTWFGSLVGVLGGCVILGFWRCDLFGFLMVWIGGLRVFLDSAFVCGLRMGGLGFGWIVVVGFDCGGWCLACGVWVVGLGWLVCVLRAVF